MTKIVTRWQRREITTVRRLAKEGSI
ncbi:MAG: hypothetical protein HKN58_01710 [Xanthomonadales bacterium]|nr:hypothetical protein [Xanthomonadales bacterium]